MIDYFKIQRCYLLGIALTCVFILAVTTMLSLTIPYIQFNDYTRYKLRHLLLWTACGMPDNSVDRSIFHIRHVISTTATRYALYTAFCIALFTLGNYNLKLVNENKKVFKIASYAVLAITQYRRVLECSMIMLTTPSALVLVSMGMGVIVFITRGRTTTLEKLCIYPICIQILCSLDFLFINDLARRMKGAGAVPIESLDGIDPNAVQEIVAMCSKEGVARDNIFVIDKKNMNAAASSNFRTKVIFFHKPMIDAFSTRQLLGVLAHELGHIANNHIFLKILFSIGTNFVALFCFYATARIFCKKIGALNTAISILIFGHFFNLMSMLANNHNVSHAMEFSADKYAVAQGRGSDLALGLLTISYADTNGLLFDYCKAYGMNMSHPSTFKRILALLKVIE